MHTYRKADTMKMQQLKYLIMKTLLQSSTQTYEYRAFFDFTRSRLKLYPTISILPLISQMSQVVQYIFKNIFILGSATN